MKTRIAILGGGITGAVVAHELVKRGGFEIHLFEKNPHLGGLHRSECLEGLQFDIGTFMFPSWHEMFRSFPALRSRFVKLEFASKAIRRPGSFDGYPMTWKGYRTEFGLFQSLLDVARIPISKALNFRKDEFLRYIHYYLGPGIYRHSGLKAYVERLYQLGDREIDLTFATQRLHHLKNLGSIRVHALRILRNVLPAVQVVPGEPAEENYVRPPEGFLSVYQAIRRELEDKGVRIVTEARIGKVDTVPGGFILDGTAYDRLISTIPIPALASLLNLDLGARCESMDLVSLFYRLRGRFEGDGSVFFNFTQEGAWKRVTVFSKFYGLVDGAHYFTVETIKREAAPLDIEANRAEFEGHARRLGLLEGDLEFLGSAHSPTAYPVLRASEMAKIRKAGTLIASMGIHMVGRQGTFAYLSSSQAAESGRRLAESIVAKDG